MRIGANGLVASSILAAALSLSGCAQTPYDVVFSGGAVLDGLGNEAKFIDVGVRKGRIVRFAPEGDLSQVATLVRIDARGLTLVPGFIDTHSHAAEGLADPERAGAASLLLQGITTVILNPDGDGALDLDQQRTAILEAQPGVHFGQLAAHGRIRLEVLGMEDRAPSPNELATMREHVRRSMRQGALGLSSGPFYAPGSFSKTAELIALAEVVAEEGGGVYQSHIRDESTYSIGLVAAVQEVIEVAEAAGVIGIVTHIKALGPQVWGHSKQVVEAIELARSRGTAVFADQYPYEASATGLAAALVPRWAQEGGPDAISRRLETPSIKARILNEMQANLERRGGAKRIRIRFYEGQPELAGKTLAKISSDRGQEPLETVLDLVNSGDVRIVSFNMDGNDIDAFARQRWTMTASDGGLPEWGVGVPHPRSFGTFPRKLRAFAIERQIQSVPMAVRSMTSLPAEVFGLEHRGVLRRGAIADLVLIDMKAVEDRATYDEPFQLAKGIRTVLIEGKLAVDKGQPTGLRAGQALTRSPGIRPGLD